MKQKSKVFILSLIAGVLAFSIPALKDGRIKEIINKITIAQADGILEPTYSGTYYSKVDTSLKGDALLKSISSTLSSTHKAKSYDDLYTGYKTTDIKEGTTDIIWDMYSNENYKLSSDRCGNYSSEGDCFNREHSIPQSWFDQNSPMRSDIHHVFPTDGKVNGMRSNHPHGDVATPTYTSKNGSMLGSCSSKYYSSTVFEPIDEYKGDFARAYLYMATRYYSQLGTWTAGQAQKVFKSSYPYLSNFAIDTYVRWALQDPVSKKEINRNEAAYKFQGNRNPYVDHPQWVLDIWGEHYKALANGELPPVISSSTSTSSSSKVSSNNGLEAEGRINITPTSGSGSLNKESTNVDKLDVSSYFSFDKSFIEKVEMEYKSSIYFYVKKGEFRLYGSGGDGTKLTIYPVEGYKLTDISCTQSSSVALSLKVSVDGSFATIQNVANGSDKAYISNISVGYTSKTNGNPIDGDNILSGVKTKVSLSNYYKVEDDIYYVNAATLDFSLTLSDDIIDFALNKDKNSKLGVIYFKDEVKDPSDIISLANGKNLSSYIDSLRNFYTFEYIQSSIEDMKRIYCTCYYDFKKVNVENKLFAIGYIEVNNSMFLAEPTNRSILDIALELQDTKCNNPSSEEFKVLDAIINKSIK